MKLDKNSTANVPLSASQAQLPGMYHWGCHRQVHSELGCEWIVKDYTTKNFAMRESCDTSG